ncbi:hypothetical protein J4446_03020 [Candidatus Woesearchaeota archaeon]|nr:hypothetical protein [Candidatus Woesearchaeota archaeon]
MKSKTYKGWLYIPILILGINFLVRIINQSKITKQFPLDLTNDWSSYISLLFFLKECGFHQFCSYWYNGFITFKLVAPGWYFFSYLINLITNNYLVTAYISMILIFLFGFLIIYKFGNKFKLTKEKRILFFLLLFTNAAAIGNYIRLGRLPEFFAFMVFVLFAFIVLYYKDKKFDWYILFIIPIYALLIISHQTVAILSSILWLSLLLIKEGKTRIKILLIILISFLIDSFWVIPYIKDFYNSAGTIYPIGANLLNFSGSYLLENIFTIIIPLVFLWILWKYLKNKKYEKKEILFYSPIALIAIMLLFRIPAFLPILKYIYPDVFMGFLLFFIFFLFFKEFKINKLFLIGIIIISIISVLISMFYTPWFIGHTQLEKDTLEIMKEIDTNFLMTDSHSKTSYGKAYYSYAPIYLNISTPSGWYKIPSEEYFSRLREFGNSVKNKDCNSLVENKEYLKNDYLISYDEDCNFLESCNLNKINQINNVCLYKFN